MRDLKRSMLDYDPETLAAIAASRGIDVGGDPEAMRESLVRQGGSRLSLSLLWEQLAEPERQALCRLAAGGGAVRAVYFESDYGALRPFGPGRLARERLWEHPANLTERLYFLGLIFRGFEEGGEAATWYVPGDVLAALPVLACPPDAAGRPQPTPTAAAVRPAGDIVCQALLQVLIAARAGQRRPSRAAAARLALEAADLDEERLQWLGRLGERLAHDLGYLSGSHVTPGGRARARRWLALERRQAVARAASAWAASDWSELREAPGLTFEGGQLPDARPARDTVLRALGTFAPGAWYGVQDLKAWLRREQPGFLRANADFDSLYVRDAASGAPLDGIAAWMGVEGRFVDEVLFALNGLGAVDLGSAGEARLFAVAPGAWWRSEPAAVPATALPLSLRADLSLVASDAITYVQLYQAEAFAEPRGHGAFSITRVSLQRAEAAGASLDSVCAFLQRYAAADAEAIARVRRLLQPPLLVAEPMVALESDDAAALAVVLQAEGLADAVRRLDDGRLTLGRDAWQRLAERLRALGWRVERQR